MLKENGDPVRRGDLLVRLDDTAIRDSLTAAEASTRAAAQAYEQAERQFQRMKTLRETGMVSAQQLEDAEIRRNTAQSELEAAKTRVVHARQQLERTEVRAPFDGIVSDRKVSAGDTAQIGKELLKVIDPASLRFEGLVSADSVGEVKAGQHVCFRVHGLRRAGFRRQGDAREPGGQRHDAPGRSAGGLRRAKQQPNLAGLYAEGRIETAAPQPHAARRRVVREGDNAFAWRVKDAKLQKVALTLGERDPRTGDFALKGGLAEGDQVMRYPTPR